VPDTSFEKMVLNDDRLRVFNDTVPAGILVLSIDTGKVVFSNRYFNEILGSGNGEENHILGESWESFFVDADERQDLMVKFVEEDEVRNYELRLKRQNGDVVWGLVSMSGIPIVEEDLLLFAFIDITSLKEAEEEIRILANHDALTGLPSLRLLQDRITAAINRAKREKDELSVLFIDLDGFKAVNDTYGHDVGDEVLKGASARLLECMRDSDTVSRIGGDEFVVVIERFKDREMARQIGERIVHSLNQPIKVGDAEVTIGASVGGAFYPDNGEDSEALIKAADDAMYTVKKDTKGAITFA
jgi:diguanylate cyclase (GGDEF)-like protein/PAS domain S-box-containing protein